ncbi:hypothetical protein ACI2KS_04140 [Pseudomonas sp. NPDC087358]|uniref:hypothetical protein n=1 Tax=Pseudomonas sp. NPDC087358 TaxID=3364439 RepID=UPI00384C7482
MNKKNIAAALLAISLASLTGSALAEPVANNLNFCTKRSGSISPGTVAPRQEKVIYGPYTVTCGTTNHHFTVRGASGQIPVKVQKYVNGNWNSVTSPTYDPSGRYGSGTFRLVIDNLRNERSASYRGSFTVPM